MARHGKKYSEIKKKAPQTPVSIEEAVAFAKAHPGAKFDETVELALRWPGPGSTVLNVGTGRNHSVMDMLAAVSEGAAPMVEHQAAHPADVPETLASITAAWVQIGWKPRIFFPDGVDS